MSGQGRIGNVGIMMAGGRRGDDYISQGEGEGGWRLVSEVVYREEGEN